MSAKRNPFTETAQKRARKNIDVIKALLNDANDLVGLVDERLTHFPKSVNWADVGDLAYYRQCLNELLRREDKDPE